MVQDWLKAGVKPVWVVEPSDNTVAVYDEGWKYTILNEHDELDGKDILPGLNVR